MRKDANKERRRTWPPSPVQARVLVGRAVRVERRSVAAGGLSDGWPCRASSSPEVAAGAAVVKAGCGRPMRIRQEPQPPTRQLTGPPTRAVDAPSPSVGAADDAADGAASWPPKTVPSPFVSWNPLRLSALGVVVGADRTPDRREIDRRATAERGGCPDQQADQTERRAARPRAAWKTRRATSRSAARIACHPRGRRRCASAGVRRKSRGLAGPDAPGPFALYDREQIGVELGAWRTVREPRIRQASLGQLRDRRQRPRR